MSNIPVGDGLRAQMDKANVHQYNTLSATDLNELFQSILYPNVQGRQLVMSTGEAGVSQFYKALYGQADSYANSYNIETIWRDDPRLAEIERKKQEHFNSLSTEELIDKLYL